MQPLKTSFNQKYKNNDEKKKKENTENKFKLMQKREINKQQIKIKKEI